MRGGSSILFRMLDFRGAPVSIGFLVVLASVASSTAASAVVRHGDECELKFVRKDLSGTVINSEVRVCSGLEMNCVIR